MVKGGMSVVKFLLFAFNFVFVVCGIALIVVGAIVQTSGKEYTTFLGSKYVTAPTIIIVTGCVIFLIAFLGCCGAIKQNYCMVTTFGVLLFLIFVIELAGGITAYVYRNELEDYLEKNMQKLFKDRFKDDVRTVWDEMEINLKCCGVNSSKNYVPPEKIPPSCCGKGTEPCDETKAYTAGCFEKLRDLFKDKIAMVGGAGIGIAFIEILGMIFAWCLASAIKKEYEGV